MKLAVDIDKKDRSVRTAAWTSVSGLVAFVAMVALVPGQFSDPFVMFDDYPVLLAKEASYYPKTLSEGRWINWLWTLRDWGTDPLGLQTIYLASWCLAMAMLATAVLPQRSVSWSLLAVPALVLSPPFIQLYTFATLVPMAVLGATFLLLARMGRMWRIWALLLFVAPAVMVHGALAYLFLTIAILLEASRPDLRQLIRLCLAFGVSFALGVLVIFVLNHAAHGSFGVEVAEWRRASDGVARDPIERGVAAVQTSLNWFWSRFFGGSAIGWVVLCTVACCIALLLLRRPATALTVLVAALAGLTVAVVQILATGVPMPERGFFFLWPAIVAPAIFVVDAAEQWVTRALAAFALVCLSCFGAIHWIAAYERFAPLMAESRRMGAAIAAAPSGEVLAAGERIARVRYFADTTDGVAWHIWLEHRLEGLTGREVIVCPLPRQRCSRRAGIWPGIAPFPMERLGEIAAMPAWPSPRALEPSGDGPLLLRLPDNPAP